MKTRLLKKCAPFWDITQRIAVKSLKPFRNKLSNPHSGVKKFKHRGLLKSILGRKRQY